MFRNINKSNSRRLETLSENMTRRPRNKFAHMQRGPPRHRRPNPMARNEFEAQDFYSQDQFSVGSRPSESFQTELSNSVNKNQMQGPSQMQRTTGFQPRARKQRSSNSCHDFGFAPELSCGFISQTQDAVATREPMQPKDLRSISCDADQLDLIQVSPEKPNYNIKGASLVSSQFSAMAPSTQTQQQESQIHPTQDGLMSQQVQSAQLAQSVQPAQPGETAQAQIDQLSSKLDSVMSSILSQLNPSLSQSQNMPTAPAAQDDAEQVKMAADTVMTQKSTQPATQVSKQTKSFKSKAVKPVPRHRQLNADCDEVKEQDNSDDSDYERRNILSEDCRSSSSEHENEQEHKKATKKRLKTKKLSNNKKLIKETPEISHKRQRGRSRKIEAKPSKTCSIPASKKYKQTRLISEILPKKKQGVRFSRDRKIQSKICGVLTRRMSQSFSEDQSSSASSDSSESRSSHIEDSATSEESLTLFEDPERTASYLIKRLQTLARKVDLVFSNVKFGPSQDFSESGSAEGDGVRRVGKKEFKRFDNEIRKVGRRTGLLGTAFSTAIRFRKSLFPQEEEPYPQVPLPLTSQYLGVYQPRSLKKKREGGNPFASPLHLIIHADSQLKKEIELVLKRLADDN
ncbi:unnamed protein product [Moneuplotes crassus]|uniref:Uncharacterized protein n=1 Tax=Euplotes crassus TaxID=5936 RepID=A0AAD1X335_EUPCR|nr:unnamed protein product [Moneuplotes crassus]